MEEILGINVVTAIVLIGLVTGATELVNQISKKNWTAVITIVVAGLIGGVAGWAMGIMPLIGIVYGLAATGYVTLAQNIGKQNGKGS